MNKLQLQKTFGGSTIHESEFTINEKIILGSGAFATVFAGRYQGAEAAVKVFNLTNVSIDEQSKLKKDMAKEVQVMKTLNESPRIIRMFGWCELPEKQQLLLLMERAVAASKMKNCVWTAPARASGSRLGPSRKSEKTIDKTIYEPTHLQTRFSSKKYLERSPQNR